MRLWAATILKLQRRLRLVESRKAQDPSRLRTRTANIKRPSRRPYVLGVRSTKMLDPGARIFLGIFFFFWGGGFCAVSGNLEAPLHHLWPFGSTPGLPDDHFWPNHGSKTIVRAFGF